MSVTGQCLCGTISYSIDNQPAMTGVCHCKNCQRQAGSAFSTLAGVPLNELHISGEPKLYIDPDTDSGNTVKRFFAVTVDRPFIPRCKARQIWCT